jgi:hypothetical protein
MIPNNSEINDIRQIADFKGETFSRFKKSEVRKQIIESMMNCKIEKACYWSAELICAGQYGDLWETIFHYIGKHIHLGNPKIIPYIEMRFQIFRNIITSGKIQYELQLRNNYTIRNLFAEIITILTYSNRKNSFETIKIKREEEYDITQISERLKAPSMKYAEPIFKKEDAKELFIAINEFAYNISSDIKSMIHACYWIEWIIDFEILCRKRKTPCICEKRSYIPIEDKFQKDPIWIIWDSIFHQSVIINNSFITKLIQSLHNIFCIKYTHGSPKKRKYLLYYAISLLTENVPTNTELIKNKELIKMVTSKINDVYKQIKKNEQSPGTDYLFSNLEKQANYENTIRKLELMDSIDFVPRTENNV